MVACWSPWARAAPCGPWHAASGAHGTGAAPGASCRSGRRRRSCRTASSACSRWTRSSSDYETSSAPIYPPDLLAIGAEGQVDAIYVVDTVGVVDTTTIQVEHSDDPRFTESVRDALGLMRFHPARRDGRKVRQMVQQRFRFRIVPPSQMAKQIGLGAAPAPLPAPAPSDGALASA